MGDQLPNPCLVVGNLPSIVSGADGDIHRGLSYIDAHVVASCSINTSCELLARPFKMRTWVAQATVRDLLRERCGDPRFLAAFHDQGEIGLPHPGPPK